MPGTPTIHKDDKKSKDSQVTIAHPVKEGELSSGTLTESGIREIGREADLLAEREVREHLGDEARRAQPEPDLGPDLEDHGVKSPDAEASKVIEKVNVGLSEEEFESVKGAKVSGQTDSEKNVLGVASIIALAMWIGRAMKKTHEAITFAFRKSPKKSVEDKGSEE